MRRSIWTFWLATLISGWGCESGSPDQEPRPAYRAAAGAIETADGHVLYLRGVNLSGQAKGTADHLFPVDQQVIDTLFDSGLNSVRLLTFWDAVCPDDPQTIDSSYLSGLAERVASLDAAGVYVIVDMHQDLWGHPFAGHGAPGWACPEEITAGYAATSPWWANYLSAQISGCFDLFWSSEALQSSLADAWVAVAEAVCPAERVIGFDLLNEPWPGSGLGNAQFDNEVLLPFYLRLMERIEAVCPGRLFFLEPSASFTFGIAAPMVLPAEVGERVVVAPHYYPGYVHEPDGAGYDGDAEVLRENVLAGLQTYLQAEIPLWVGEYGGMTDSQNFSAYFSDLHAIFIDHFISSALWDYYADDGGFALLDSAGQLKDVYRPVFGTPLFTRLPARPTAFEVNWTAGTAMVEVRCEKKKSFTLLLPASAACSCQATPADGLGLPLVQAGPIEVSCARTGQVSLACSCP